MTQRPTVDEALEIIRRNASSMPEEICPTAEALGRVSSAGVAAARDHPPFDMSAMDGFAVREDDIARGSAGTPLALHIGSPLFAGSPVADIPDGHVLPISTGARVPANCGAVLIREYADVRDGALWLAEALPKGRNIRRAGEDTFAGQRVLDAGTVINPGMIGTLLSYGVRQLPVRKRPVATIIPTGDELAAVAENASILDANGPMVRACLHSAGIAAHLHAPVEDDPVAIAKALEREIASRESDILITSGGVSAGTRDLILGVIKSLGATVHFHGVQMRPGKPILFATLPTGQLFFGLPGNPVAALVGCRFFVLAALRAMLGRPPETGRPIEPPAEGKSGTTVFLKACSAGSPSSATILPGQQSHMMSALLQSDCWVRVDGYGAFTATLYPRDPQL